MAFWFFSIAGGAILFVYALSRQDPVFIAGQGAGLLIYARNLWLIFRERRSAAREHVRRHRPPRSHAEVGQRLVEILDQVGRILEPDVEADDRLVLRPARCGARRC